MKFLVYGHKGWIGQQVVNLLQNKYDIAYGEARLDDEPNVEEEILKHSPDRVVSLTGRTHGPGINNVDYLEQPGKLVENVKDNLYGPLVLALICKKYNIHLTYLGTGCLFHDDGNPENNFDEEGKPNFFGSSYSTIKGFTDRIMHQFKENVLNVRIRMCLTDEPHYRNFITKLTTYEYICSTPNSWSVLPELLPVMVDMVKKKTTGTINLTNPGAITHNEILEMYKEIVDPSFTWKNFSINDQNKILKSKRSSNVLKTDKLQALYPNVTPIKEAVRKCLHRMAQNTTTYKPNAVLITGGCGFIGSNTLTYMANKYGDVEFVNIDKLDYCSKEANVRINERRNAKYTFYKGNINDISLVSDILKKHSIDTIIHFAAQTHVDNSFGNSVHFTEDNILGTHSLMEACNGYGKIKRFIHISTDEVYGEVTDDHLGCYEESSLLNPTNPYAATKASAEFIARSYMHSFNLPIIITRGNNVYGPYQYPEKVVPKFAMQLLNNKKCTLHGEGKAKRNFIHVDDTATAIEAILIHGKIGEIYNIGTRNEYTVQDIAKILIANIKPNENPDDWIIYVKDRNFNDYRYHINSNKLLSLGWTEQNKFEDGIKSTIEWYRNNQNLYDIKKILE